MMPDSSATRKVTSDEGSVFKQQKEEFEEHALESELISQRTADNKTEATERGVTSIDAQETSSNARTANHHPTRSVPQFGSENIRDSNFQSVAAVVSDRDYQENETQERFDQPQYYMTGANDSKPPRGPHV